jgi:hypothetical protein
MTPALTAQRMNGSGAINAYVALRGYEQIHSHSRPFPIAVCAPSRPTELRTTNIHTGSVSWAPKIAVLRGPAMSSVMPATLCNRGLGLSNRGLPAVVRLQLVFPTPCTSTETPQVPRATSGAPSHWTSARSGVAPPWLPTPSRQLKAQGSRARWRNLCERSAQPSIRRRTRYTRPRSLLPQSEPLTADLPQRADVGSPQAILSQSAMSIMRMVPYRKEVGELAGRQSLGRIVGFRTIDERDRCGSPTI